jgi:hypothetical protein
MFSIENRPKIKKLDAPSNFLTPKTLYGVEISALAMANPLE